MANNGEVITPFKIMGDPNEGLVLAKFIHGVGNDTTGSAPLLNLSGVKVEASVESVQKAIELQTPFNATVVSGNSTFQVVVDPTNSTVDRCLNDGSCQPVNYRQWLILIYMDADNSLNDYATLDLQELQSVTYSPQVKLIALVDYYGSGFSQVAESDELTGTLKVSNSTYEPDMGSPTTLQEFVSKYYARYPAPKVALIMWNHGDGWRSTKTAAEDATSNDYLFMYQMVQALNNLQAEGIKVNLIGFDECLMGMEEVAYDLAPYADAIVASESYENGYGWNYQAVMEAVNQNPSLTPVEFGKRIVDAYGQTYADQPQTYPQTLSLYTPDFAYQVAGYLDQLYYLLNEQTLPIFERARSEAKVVENTNHVDLLSFAENLYQEASAAQEEELAQVALKLVQTVNGTYRAVIPSTSGESLGGTAVYFPLYRSSDFVCYSAAVPTDCSPYYPKDYYNPFARTLWDDFLNKYYQLEGE
jgi:hypothetical protein